jgi:CubicO group peptidase (beta-lactamase class C family)
MNNTWVYDLLNDTVSSHRTKGYESNWKFSGIDYLDGVTGDKGIYSTVEDLLKWDRALYAGELIKKSTLEEAFVPAGKKRKSFKNYGYGWRIIGDDDADKIVYHNGWWRGYNTSFVRRLSDETTIIILGNRHSRNIYDIKSILSLLGGSTADLEMHHEG